MSATTTWANALYEIMRTGSLVAPNSAGGAWRGAMTRELLGYQTVWPMSLPVVLSPGRKLGYKFMAAEAAWILSGDNRVSTIRPFSKQISRFSDDGRRFFGAYGPRFIDQLSFVVETLIADSASRQAVIEIWREQPRKTKDTPCTLSLQFLIRAGKLHCVATMRSSDLWTGVPYDVFNFSMCAAMVLLELPTRDELTMGDLRLTAGSQHLYERDWPEVEAVLKETTPDCYTPPTAFDARQFDDSEHLVTHLWNLAHGRSTPDSEWLKELYRKES